MSNAATLATKIRKSVEQIIASARLPNGQVRVFKRLELEAWEAALRELIEDVGRLERCASGNASSTSSGPIHVTISDPASPELARLRDEFAARERVIYELKQEIDRRAAFLEESEALLMRKMQAQQELESRLEHLREHLEDRDRAAGLRAAEKVVIERA